MEERVGKGRLTIPILVCFRRRCEHHCPSAAHNQDMVYIITESDRTDRDSSLENSSSSSAERRERESRNRLLTCPAQSFHSRFSLAGEMFLDIRS